MLVTSVGATTLAGVSHLGPQDASLSDLLVRTGRGDVRAFTSLYDATSDRVHSLVRRAAGPDEADALTERVYVRLWHRASTFRQGDGHALAWIISLAHHESSLHGGRVPPAVRVGVASTASTLTRHQQDVLTLVYLGGYSARQVAELMQVPRTAVSDHVRSGLRRLKEELPAAS